VGVQCKVQGACTQLSGITADKVGIGK